MWSDGSRAKIKHPTYQKLHNLIFGLNEKTIWKMLKDRAPIDQVIKDVPEDIQGWVKNRANHFNVRFTAIETQILNDLQKIDRDLPRKDQADQVKKTKYPGIVFSILDNKPYSHKIWDLIRPESNETIATSHDRR